MKYRKHCGGLAESMKTVIEIPPSLTELCKVLNNEYSCVVEHIRVKPYHGVDTRNGWDTYMVLINDHPVGFTDGPIESL